MAARRGRRVVQRATVPGGGPQSDAAYAGDGGVRQCQWPLSMESVECGRAWRSRDQPVAHVPSDAVRTACEKMDSAIRYARRVSVDPQNVALPLPAVASPLAVPLLSVKDLRIAFSAQEAVR